MEIKRLKELFFNENLIPKAYYFVEKNLLKNKPNIHKEIKDFISLIGLNCKTFQQELYHFLIDL